VLTWANTVACISQQLATLVYVAPDVDRPQELATSVYYLTRARLGLVYNNSWFSLTTEERENCIHWPFCCMGQPAASTPHRNHRVIRKWSTADWRTNQERETTMNNCITKLRRSSQRLSIFSHNALSARASEHLFLLCNFAKCNAYHSQGRGDTYSEGTGWAQTPGKSVKRSVKTIYDKQFKSVAILLCRLASDVLYSAVLNP